MATRDKQIDIAVDGEHIAGTVITPATVVPGLLFVHGWGGSQQQYLTRARAVGGLGYVCLTFDLRGHARTDEQRDRVSREDNLCDLLAAYDVLAGQPGVNPSAIGIIGSSYGAYLAAIATSRRAVRWLALRAPALYKDSGWELPKRELHNDPDLAAYRRRSVQAKDNRALAACAAFRGDVLVVESEHDDIVPHPVIANYVTACVQARSLTSRLIEGADHALSEESWQRAYTSFLISWLVEMVVGANDGRSP
jgi:pimeloyl-ACP methyl ester carboxylesterase